MKVAVYTSIFGGYDNLQEQPSIENVDYICFTEANLKSNTWKIVNCPVKYSDYNRCAKEYKILPHKYLKDYEYSIWIDGNIKIVSNNLHNLIKDNLETNSIAFFDHNNTIGDPRNCIYDEAIAVCKLKKDNCDVVKRQVNRYRMEGYPENNGLICATIIVRKHTDFEVKKCMENWWTEIQNNSRRDQLSFNYVAWVNNLNYTFIPGDVRNNKYFKLNKSHNK